MERANRTEPARFLDFVSVLLRESLWYVYRAQAQAKQAKVDTWINLKASGTRREVS